MSSVDGSLARSINFVVLFLFTLPEKVPFLIEEQVFGRRSEPFLRGPPSTRSRERCPLAPSAILPRLDRASFGSPCPVGAFRATWAWECPLTAGRVSVGRKVPPPYGASGFRYLVSLPPRASGDVPGQ